MGMRGPRHGREKYLPVLDESIGAVSPPFDLRRPLHIFGGKLRAVSAVFWRAFARSAKQLQLDRPQGKQEERGAREACCITAIGPGPRTALSEPTSV